MRRTGRHPGRSLGTVLAALAMAVLPGAHAMAQDNNPLSELVWKQRPVLLFAKSRSDASLDKQIDLFRERRSDLKSRDIVVLRTAGSEETRAVIGYTSLPEGSGFELRRKYRPRPSGLTVILVGKDGGEKARWDRLVQPEEIFDLIDSMPMRQREMREDGTPTN